MEGCVIVHRLLEEAMLDGGVNVGDEAVSYSVGAITDKSFLDQNDVP